MTKMTPGRLVRAIGGSAYIFAVDCVGGVRAEASKLLEAKTFWHIRNQLATSTADDVLDQVASNSEFVGAQLRATLGRFHPGSCVKSQASLEVTRWEESQWSKLLSRKAMRLSLMGEIVDAMEDPIADQLSEVENHTWEQVEDL